MDFEMKQKKIGLLFPGQGSQYVGMGYNLFEKYPQIRDYFTQANEILGYDLTRICFEGPAEELQNTGNCQPALFLVSAIAYALLKESIQPADIIASAGLSLGEYTALYAAGVLSFADALRLLRQRGLYMEEACKENPGAMASIIGMDLSTLKQYIHDTFPQGDVVIANINAPEQLVLSGTQNGINQAIQDVKSLGAKRAISLKVAGAFHSPAMSAAKTKLGAAFASVPIGGFSHRVLSNFKGDFYTDLHEVKPLLVEQLTGTVQWHACVEHMMQAGVNTFIELGCGTVLSNLVKRIDARQQITILNIEDEETVLRLKEVFSCCSLAK